MKFSCFSCPSRPGDGNEKRLEASYGGKSHKHLLMQFVLHNNTEFICQAIWLKIPSKCPAAVLTPHAPLLSAAK